MVPVNYLDIDPNSLAAVIQSIQNAQVNNGCQQIQLPNGNLYEGEMHNDVPHGKGTLNYKQPNEKKCERYEGDFVNGVPHGLGKMFWTDGSIFEGAFETDNVQGHGIKIWCIGKQDRNYVGEWKNGQMDGQGTMISVNKETKWKMIYEGEWKNDQMDGQGTITTKHPKASEIFPRATRSSDKGDIHNLEIEDNKQTGVFKDGKLWEGECEAGKFTFYYVNGEKQPASNSGKQPKEFAAAIHPVHDAQANAGYQKIQLFDRDLYEGEVQKAVPHGKGILHYKQLNEIFFERYDGEKQPINNIGIKSKASNSGKQPEKDNCIIF